VELKKIQNWDILSEKNTKLGYFEGKKYKIVKFSDLSNSFWESIEVFAPIFIFLLGIVATHS
jgi:hypothetical protein